MSPFLFLLLSLFHFKSTQGLHLPFFPADLPALLLHFFPLSLKSLLGFRPYTGVLQVLSRIPASSFGIVSHLSYFCFDSRTENQFIVVVQDVIPDKVTLQADSFPSSIRSKTPTQNGSSKNTVRLAFIDLPARRHLRWQRITPSFFDPVIQKSHLPFRMEPVLSFFHHC